MAESKKGSSSSEGSKKSSGSDGGSSQSSQKRSARDVVADAAGQLQELIGRPVEAVLGIEKDGSEWAVTVEVLELERVPNTTDVLGRYEVTLDGDGEIVAAHRTKRYVRSQSGDE
jgi:hypothetical protein